MSRARVSYRYYEDARQCCPISHLLSWVHMALTVFTGTPLSFIGKATKLEYRIMMLVVVE